MSSVTSKVIAGLRYVQQYPQIIFALMLLIVVPFLFLYTGQQFLEAGKANQDKLQRDRVGTLHDTLLTVLSVTNYDSESLRNELNKLVTLNPDITDYTLAKETNEGIKILVSHNVSNEGEIIKDDSLFMSASLRTDSSFIFEYLNSSNNRVWSAYRASRDSLGDFYFIQTELSLASVDASLHNREQDAYFSLIFVYIFLLALAYWHIKLTDYQHLYTQAKQAIETKDLFTNMIAHELRAPLTAIRGYADLLSDHLKEPQEKEQAARIENSAERLIVIVNDLLDVARIQSGQLALKTADVDIIPVINNVIDELQVVAKEKGSLVSADLGIKSQNALVDTSRLQQVLTNIVSNAIKYTEKGEITVVVNDLRKTVEVRVQDNGMGISSEDQKKLFAPFFRVSGENMSTITGTGLGMWITKQLVELMGGSIGIESIKGVGTHVVISLPKK